jgi:hypothetical protein
MFRVFFTITSTIFLAFAALPFIGILAAVNAMDVDKRHARLSEAKQ